MTADGKTLLTAGADRTVKLWNLSTGKVRHTLEGHSVHITSLAVTPDGHVAASGGGTPVPTGMTKLLASDREVRLWDLTESKLRTRLPMPAAVTDLAFSPDGTLLAVALQDTYAEGKKPLPPGEIISRRGEVQIWDWAGARLVHRIRDESDHRPLVVPTRIAWAPSGQSLAIAAYPYPDVLTRLRLRPTRHGKIAA